MADRLSTTRQSGFSLVELMVVLALLGMASVAVMLTLPTQGDSASGEATRFAARAAALRDRAVVDGRPMGLWVTASGYGFEMRVDGAWQPIVDRTLARADWAAGTAASVNGAAQGRLRFDRTGLPDAPLRVDLTNGAAQSSATITAAGEVEVR